MYTATILLTLIGLLGALDIAYFHTWRGRLVLRAEARREAWIHVARGFCYAAQFLVVPHLRLSGAWYAALLALYVVDVGIAVADVLEEPRSRAAQGGLTGGEYLMHIILSVLVGAYLYAVLSNTWHWALEPTALRVESDVPRWLKGLGACMALGAAGTALLEALVLLEQRMGPPRPLHVRVRLEAPLEAVWNVTQDHRLHPRWDHRFSHIELCHDAPPAAQAEAGFQRAPEGTPDPRIRTGTRMRYEKRLLGMTIHGYGRYKLHRPLRQSTFEFGSEDARSLIRRGVGLWLYTPLADGRVEFSTAYTYEVRWGAMGRLIDRLLFRPLFQRYTEQSFRRLARRYFGQPRPRVLGRAGRGPERFEAVGVAR